MANAKSKEAESTSDNTGLVSIEDRIKSRLANVNTNTPAPASKKISTKGSQFTLPNGSSSAGPLNCIIVDYVNMNSYYPDAYDPNNIKPPSCYAIGRNITELAPHATVEDKQADACMTCKWNEFGSAGRGKACKNKVVLAVLPEGFDAESELFTLQVSPTGLKVWASYVRMLSEQGVDPVQVITSINFKEGVTYPTLTFRHIGGNERVQEVAPFLPEADTLLNSVSSAEG